MKREALRIEREKKRKEKMEAAGKKKSVLKEKKQPMQVRTLILLVSTAAWKRGYNVSC